MMKRPFLLAGIVVLVIAALGAGLAYAADSSSDDADARAASSTTKAHERTTTTTRRKSASSTSSTTRASTTTTTTVAVGASAAVPTTTTIPAAPAPPAVPEPEAPDPPNPSDAYVAKQLPSGVTATISGCRWVPDNGGELQAEGTLTNTAGVDDVWLISAVWLQHNQTQDEAVESTDDLLDAAVGQSVPWRLTFATPSAPPNLSCAFEVQ
jgi:hypothetical protein